MKQKLPFILIGIGIGIILTNIIFTLVPNIEYREYSQEEIIEEAKGLGMVFIKENINVDNDKHDEANDENKVEEMLFTIKEGDYLIDIANNLSSTGVIEDPNSFRNYAISIKKDKKFRVGRYNLSTTMNYDEIIDILTNIN